ncbi:MAG: hypothetical protein OEZ01_12700 [Candidatus Heimdallarchaeota archaeon]|nr:hypothetical protein [Candidatus Heimdallarchaeota archaeon]MDH5646865.1 hypothetical protein [Candidatus Heimdallarchaeota archaeon]
MFIILSGILIFTTNQLKAYLQLHLFKHLRSVKFKFKLRENLQIVYIRNENNSGTLKLLEYPVDTFINYIFILITTGFFYPGFFLIISIPLSMIDDRLIFMTVVYVEYFPYIELIFLIPIIFLLSKFIIDPYFILRSDYMWEVVFDNNVVRSDIVGIEKGFTTSTSNELVIFSINEHLVKSIMRKNKNKDNKYSYKSYRTSGLKQLTERKLDGYKKVIYSNLSIPAVLTNDGSLTPILPIEICYKIPNNSYFSKIKKLMIFLSNAIPSMKGSFDYKFENEYILTKFDLPVPTRLSPNGTIIKTPNNDRLLYSKYRKDEKYISMKDKLLLKETNKEITESNIIDKCIICYTDIMSNEYYIECKECNRSFHTVEINHFNQKRILSGDKAICPTCKENWVENK